MQVIIIRCIISCMYMMLKKTHISVFIRSSSSSFFIMTFFSNLSVGRDTLYSSWINNNNKHNHTLRIQWMEANFISKAILELFSHFEWNWEMSTERHQNTHFKLQDIQIIVKKVILNDWIEVKWHLFWIIFRLRY